MQRPICPHCNKQPRSINYKKENKTYYRKFCHRCSKIMAGKKPRKSAWEFSGYKKKTTCDVCGFKALYSSQIAVFHVDGNMKNTALSNLKSICLNCIEVVKRKELNWKRGDLTVD